MNDLFERAFSTEKATIAIDVVSPKNIPDHPWLKASGFEAKAGSFALLPGKNQQLDSVVYVSSECFWDFAKLVNVLPEGVYHLNDPKKLCDRPLSFLAWALAHYQFDRFKKCSKPKAKLSIAGEKFNIKPEVEAAALVRDLVNMPCEQLGPEEFQSAMAELAKHHQAVLTGVVGDDLLKENFPAVHAVGRAATRAPRLLHLKWGNPDHKSICLVGKGVCFDTGGLDIKTGSGMLLMKKDMGGAAHVLGLAHLIMSYKLPVHLHVITPVVENNIAGNSYRPGDIVETRKGLTVEITNTDAEGRVILSDALQFASEQNPEFIIDFATLTGAARVATGPDIPAFFTDDETLLEKLNAGMDASKELLWRLPLHEGYREYLKSDIADMANASSGGYAGATTAGLFLKSFVPKDTPWLHIDLMSYNTVSKPGRPKGGEAQGLRAIFEMIQDLLKA